MGTEYPGRATSEAVQVRRLESRVARLEQDFDRRRRTEEERRHRRFHLTCSSAAAVLTGVVAHLASLD